MLNACSDVAYYVLSRPKFQLKKAFKSAMLSKSVDKMLKAFKQMEPCFDESDLGFECFALTIEFYNSDSPEQVLSFGNRALRILIGNDSKNVPCFGNTYAEIEFTFDGTPCNCNHKSCLYIARVCNMLGCACLELERYNECFGYLNWADRNLSKLLENDSNSVCSGKCIWDALSTTHLKLFVVKLEMGRFEEALPFGLKTLDSFTKDSVNSVEVAVIFRELANIYRELGELEKALEQNRLSQGIFKNTSRNTSNFFSGENDYGNILIGLGRYEEAIDVLNRVAHSEAEGTVRGLAFVNLAKAFLNLGKRDEAEKHMKTAQRLLGEKDAHPNCVAVGFGDMSVLYEKMNDLGKATSLLRRALSTPKIPHHLLAKGSTRLFLLISLAGKEEEGIPYMENVVEKLKEKFGPENREVGCGYRNLGAAYLKSGRGELAVEFMAQAKEIMDAKLGPHHLDSLQTSQTLAETYATMKRYELAVDCQQKVVEGFEGLGPNEQDNLDKAVRLLNQIKEMASHLQQRVL